MKIKIGKNRSVKIGRKAIYISLISVAALLIALSAYLLIDYLVPPPKPDYSSLKNTNVTIPTTPQAEDVAPEDLPENPINFAALSQQYPNAVAWIQMPGIPTIDYPIMMSTPEMDDNFYLDHNIDGDKAKEGAIYIQKVNQSRYFDEPNTVIYGHNMGNGTMFGQLKKFKNEDFFNDTENTSAPNNRTIYVFTPNHILQYEVISAFVYDDRHIINSFDFQNEEKRMEFFNTCLNPNTTTKNVLEGATLSQDDKIITLSTCTANDSKRYLVVGKLVYDFKTK